MENKIVVFGIFFLLLITPCQSADMMEINGNVHQKFIDISEWNGAISIEQYQLLKSEGIKGVVIKLTEGTLYRNPLARLQIENAKYVIAILS